jgi:3-methyladenine DNA glycosylase AlkD
VAQSSQWFFKTGPGQYGEGDRFLGVRVPELRKFARQFGSLRLPGVASLLRSKYHEERLLALLILVRQYGRGDDDEREPILRFYLDHLRFINNWDLVDLSAAQIVGRHLEHRDRGLLYELARSSKLFERRIAMIATHHYIRNREYGDALAIAELLLHDREDLIHKAAGWMLREIGKRDLEVEEKFLRKHYRDMPRTMLRYAIERLPEPERKRYLA